MIKTFFGASIFVLASHSSGLAWSEMESMTFAQELGSVLAAEELCEMAFNQEAIADFIESKVPADDMGFSSSLSLMTMGTRAQNSAMSPSERTAYCTQMRRVAKSYGFTG